MTINIHSPVCRSPRRRRRKSELHNLRRGATAVSWPLSPTFRYCPVGPLRRQGPEDGHVRPGLVAVAEDQALGDRDDPPRGVFQGVVGVIRGHHHRGGCQVVLLDRGAVKGWEAQDSRVAVGFAFFRGGHAAGGVSASSHRSCLVELGGQLCWKKR